MSQVGIIEKNKFEVKVVETLGGDMTMKQTEMNTPNLLHPSYSVTGTKATKHRDGDVDFLLVITKDDKFNFYGDYETLPKELYIDLVKKYKTENNKVAIASSIPFDVHRETIKNQGVKIVNIGFMWCEDNKIEYIGC